MTNNEDQEVQEFASFLEGADATDFDRTSSIASGPGIKRSEFASFVQENIEHVQTVYEDMDGALAPIAFLANEEEEREFEAYHDETLQDMFERLHREAVAMGAYAVFVAMIVNAARQKLDIDAMDSDQIRAAVARGDLKPYYAWYAELRTSGEPERFSGMWDIADGALGSYEEGSPAVAPLFYMVLEGVGA